MSPSSLASTSARGEHADRALDRGLSFKTTMGNVLTLTPPLTVTATQMVDALAILEEAIEAGVQAM